MPVSGNDKRIDPYISLTLEGQAAKIVKRTPADKDGGADPVWDYDITMEVVDQYLLDVEVFHQSAKGDDVLLGFCQISLLSVFRGGESSFWTALKQKKANGGFKEVGNINLRLAFHAPPALAYPLNRPEVDSFDDTVRKMPEPKKKPDDEDEDGVKKLKDPISTDPADHVKTKEQEEEEKEEEEVEDSMKLVLAAEIKEVVSEFTEAEITAAFKFIDLDHNSYVGAGEIRHILVCMGEMITDEEIDMMISMVSYYYLKKKKKKIIF
jgi:hypothetical protein